MATTQEVIAGAGGFKVVSTTAAQTGLALNAIVVNADAVFSALSVNGTDVLSAKGLSGTTIKAGAFLPAGTSNKITAFTLASGTVICYE